MSKWEQSFRAIVAARAGAGDDLKSALRYAHAAADAIDGVRAPDRTEGSRESWGVSCDVALGLVEAAAKALDTAAAVMPDGGPNAVGETVRRELFARMTGDAGSLIESIREEIADYAAGAIS